MFSKNLRRAALLNLIAGYLLSFCFISLIALSLRHSDIEIKQVKHLTSESNFTKTPKEYVHIKSPVVIYEDHLDAAYPSTGFSAPIKDDVSINRRRGSIVNTNHHEVSRNLTNDRIDYSGYSDGSGLRRSHHGGPSYNKVHHGKVSLSSPVVDSGLLDRRLRELDGSLDSIKLTSYDESVSKDALTKNKVGLIPNDKSLNLSKLTPTRDGDDMKLGDISDFNTASDGYGVGKGGELYAYNFPSQGVGAGIGSSSIGAGAGGGAGLSAAIGEGLLNGDPVPTLGGVGDGSKSLYGEPSAPAGVGGLLGGAGAGGAAGLSQGYITPSLGGGIKNGSNNGIGSGKHLGYNYDHLPENGALHIMMHVDGSGSILNTRKQLELMKNTLLKDSLLPYYKNDEDLYNKRVTIISSSGERTLRFFTEASKKDNVLAVAFQDEAQPAYHLPNFNRGPSDTYSEDLLSLKSSLRKHKGVYRGIMFQVDRGTTFAKSFKEFVGNAFKGEGYLKGDSLQQYHKDHNLNHIKNKSGIVFGDEYHAKDSEGPDYYLNLLFNASRKLGLDLNIYGAGLTDGKYKSN